MANRYLEKKIRNYSIFQTAIIIFLLLASVFVGKYFQLDNWRAVITGSFLGLIGGTGLVLIEYFIREQIQYEKGYDLELQIAKKFEKLNYDFKPHIETDFGDLDFLLKKKDVYFGIEAKNWPGLVVFENSRLQINNWDHTDVLNTLLRHCGLVRDQEFGSDSGIFINPVLIFGYKTSVNVPGNKIRFNNVDILVASINDFDKYL